MSAILTIKNLNIYYQDKKILENLNLAIQPHEIICFMGKSGSGKSTLLSSLNGFLNEKCGHFEGKILFKGEDIQKKDPIWLKRKMATLFQDSKPFPFSVEKNLTYAMEFYERKIINKKAKVEALLKSVNLWDEIGGNLSISPEQLSGGQKQRLCIARMLTTEPQILILDEPCSSLDLHNMLVIEDLIKQLAKKYTILIATHNFEQAKRLTNRIITIENKTIMEPN
ncbi:phosphate ABC transporter ATP-binding protein [Mannheimia massilioguelmaensis]|uniref:phosphate ABC transporter ATP-binding protein n=1 Tax=Mannheimia massilioguelmaensis TaxID=1604354 RepID=UPI0005CAA32A|nr:phosphate ABC transporter ATP-binding protein [Mannheimia massilioguelmaensis]